MRVVKVGGSLFDLPDLKSRLKDWLAAHNDMPNVLIAGGGKPVDAIRQFQKTHGIDDSAAHWLSLEMMSVTGSMLSSLLDGVPISDNPTIAFDSAQPTVVFQPHDWLLKQLVIAKNPLTMKEADFFQEESWSVTSDSIAAKIALDFKSRELVLLKSTDYTATNADYLDSGFAAIARELLQTESTTIKMTNFRSESTLKLSALSHCHTQAVLPGFRIQSDE